MNKLHSTSERTNRNAVARQYGLPVAALVGGLLLLTACQENGSTDPDQNKPASYVDCSQVTLESGVKRGAYTALIDLELVGKVSVQGVAVNFDDNSIHYPRAVVSAKEVAGDAATWEAHYTYNFGDDYTVGATVHATIAGKHQNIVCDPEPVEVQPMLP